MRTTIAAMTALVALATAIGAQNQTAPDAETVKLILRNERALYDAIAKGDRAAFQALVSSDGSWTTPAGTVSMDALADRLGAIELPASSIEDPRVVGMDGASAGLTYMRTGGGRFGDRPFAPLVTASTLWTKRDGRWVAVNHQESDSMAASLIPEKAQWEISFAQVEAAAGLADLRTASAGTAEARVMDRPWSSMGRHPFLRVVRRDGRMRAQLFEFWSPRLTPSARRPTGPDITCTEDVCVRPLALKEQLDWGAVFEGVTDQYACGLTVGNVVAACGDCDQVWIKTTAQEKYREQSCQMPPAGTPAATLLDFMRRAARATAY